MADPTSESWQIFFFGGAAAFVLYQMVRGWQLGIVRVVAKILAVVAAYVCAWMAAPHLVPILQPVGLPDPVLMGVGGVLVGVLVFVVISLTSAVLFKKTSDQSVGVVRFGYGAAGSVMGMLIGIFFVWLAVLGVRVFGTLVGQGNSGQTGESGAVARGFAQMKESLEQGPAGAVMEQVDPIPGSFYSTIAKIGQMTSKPESAQRFIDFPGIAPLAAHSKILALRDDPEIARDALAGNYFALIRNPHVISVANDPEIFELLKKVEFQKALDYAVATPDNRPVPSRNDL